jgi:hypothetical protein
VSTAALLVVAAIALACPLHMLWRMRHGRGACCPPVRSATAAALRERQRELAARTEWLASSEARREAAPDRH